MNIIITMAGLGSRFKKAGYNVPKYMIEVNGKSLFEWSMSSLKGYNKNSSRYIFIVRKEDNSKIFIERKCAEININNIKIIELEELTDGQATTAMLAMPYCDENESIMIYNIDTYVEPYEMKYEDILGDGYIPCFHADGDHWSFAKLDKNNENVIEIREKERISDNCTIGAYYFASAGMYQKIYNEYYSNNENIEKNEKYIAPLYNYMIKKGLKVNISIIDNKKVHVLGTPEELEKFKK